MSGDLLDIRPASACRWDCAALGEVMLRFDPGFGRVRNARRFEVWEGGGEYNMARGLRKTFGLRSTALTALPDNEVGRLVEDLMMQGGVDASHLIWREYDGVGRNTRVGLNFTEKGFGLRAPLGVSDRGNSAASQIAPGEFDWERLFGREGVRWFHTGGIFAALSPSTAQVVLEAVRAAKAHGVIVSYDLNYRASLWRTLGDPVAVQAQNREIARHVDVMFGDAEGFKTCLGVDAAGVDLSRDPMDRANFEALAKTCRTEFPDFKVLATTLRRARSATLNEWSAVLSAGGEIYQAATREGLEIYDRVGGGDAFASGAAYALIENLGPQAAVDYGAAHGALAMTTPGDNAMVNAQEVKAAITSGAARVIR